MPNPPTTERTDPLIGAIIVDRFKIRGRLGAGGFGVVYRADQLSIDRPVAIKVLGLRSSGPVARKRFQREAQVLSRLTSPHTVRLIDFGVLDDGRFFYVMEYLEGETLEDLIARGPIPVDVALRVAEQICHALQEAHGQQVVHRDLKPANIWLQQVSGDRVVRLLDFGTARLLDSDAVTRSEVLIGTPAYLAPEQCRSGEIDGRADLYALGLVIFEMLAGRHPFGDGVLAEMVYRHVHEDPPNLLEAVSGVPPLLDSLVLRLLAKRPDERPESAWAVRLELERLLSGRGSGRVMGLAPTARYDAIPDMSATAPSIRAFEPTSRPPREDRRTRSLDRSILREIVDRPPVDDVPTVPSLGPDFRADVMAGVLAGSGEGEPSLSVMLTTVEVPRRRRPWPLVLLLMGCVVGIGIAVSLPGPTVADDPGDATTPIKVGMTPPPDAGSMTGTVLVEAAPGDTSVDAEPDAAVNAARPGAARTDRASRQRRSRSATTPRAAPVPDANPPAANPPASRQDGSDEDITHMLFQ